jgi:hypothetical protein
VSRNQCLLRYGRCWCDLYSRCYMWFPCVSTQLSALRRPEVNTLSKTSASIESCDRHSLLVAVIPPNHWSALNNTKAFIVPRAENPEDWGQEIVQATWMDLRVVSTVHRKSGSGAVRQCRGKEVVPHNAWTTRAVVDEEAHVPNIPVNISAKNDGKLTPVSLLCKTTGPKSWSSQMPTQTLTENTCWCLDATVMWGLSFIQTWFLWKFTIPSHVNPAVSVKLCVYNAFREKPFAKHRSCTRSAGVDACGWMRYGLSDCSCITLQTRGTQTPSAAAILGAYVPKSSPTLVNTRTSRKLSHLSAGICFWI